jgi:hypothetical protein
MQTALRRFGEVIHVALLDAMLVFFILKQRVNLSDQVMSFSGSCSVAARSHSANHFSFSRISRSLRAAVCTHLAINVFSSI